MRWCCLKTWQLRYSYVAFHSEKVAIGNETIVATGNVFLHIPNDVLAEFEWLETTRNSWSKRK